MERQRTFTSRAVAVAAAVAFVVAGLGGYLIGHGSGDDAERTGYDKGVTVGVEQGRAEYSRGAPAYARIYEKGKADGVHEGTAAGEQAGEAQGESSGEQQGEHVGFEQGQSVGVTTGEREGVAQGAAAVLGGFANWTDGAFYLVTVRESATIGVPVELTSRSQLQPGASYKLCDEGGSTQVCEASTASETAPSAGDGSAEGTGE